MTDLCFEEQAEQLCEAAITNALQSYPDSLDGAQALANFRLSQKRPNDAAAIIETVHTRLMKVKDSAHSRTVIEEITGAPDPVELQGIAWLKNCLLLLSQ